VIAIIFVIVLLSKEKLNITDEFTNTNSIKATARGAFGEDVVNFVLGRTKEGKKYVISDLILDINGKTTQIDHIVINPRGIFVIETKNYSGRIYGSENQLEWTQVLKYGKEKHKLYNPLKQNATHVAYVKKLVGKLPVFSLVVFVKNNVVNINAPNVISVSKLNKRLKSGEDVLGPSLMKSAYETLLNNRSSATTEEHVKNIKTTQENLQMGICPRCNNKLVLRKGKYGDFWGCSNYPKCKFIKKK
jgi:hypothetical protein